MTAYLWCSLSGLQAVLLVADLCLEYQVYDPQLWNGLLQKMLGFNLVRRMHQKKSDNTRLIVHFHFLVFKCKFGTYLSLPSDQPPPGSARGSSLCACSVGGNAIFHCFVSEMRIRSHNVFYISNMKYKVKLFVGWDLLEHHKMLIIFIFSRFPVSLGPGGVQYWHLLSQVCI